jgi:catechol 2,3-dioxygenase-like lactoylglutathione lyase family enzyme
MIQFYTKTLGFRFVDPYESPPQGVSLMKVKVKVTLRLTVSQSVSFGVETHLELMTRYLLLFDSYGHISVGRHL